MQHPRKTKEAWFDWMQKRGSLSSPVHPSLGRVVSLSVYIWPLLLKSRAHVRKCCERSKQLWIYRSFFQESRLREKLELFLATSRCWRMLEYTETTQLPTGEKFPCCRSFRPGTDAIPEVTNNQWRLLPLRDHWAPPQMFIKNSWTNFLLSPAFLRRCSFSP